MDELINQLGNLKVDKDISGLSNIDELYSKNDIKTYIKLIPFDKTVDYEEYPFKENFVHVADIILDTELDASGDKKRDTLITLKNCIENYEVKTEWIYIFVINGRIVKIGGTRNGIKERWTSYLCGHHVKERGKSGKASETNKYLYNTFHFYLEAGCEIKMYGHKLPVEEITRTVYGTESVIRVQTYHMYESTLIDAFNKEYSFIPFLCNNSDPDYKKTVQKQPKKSIREYF